MCWRGPCTTVLYQVAWEGISAKVTLKCRPAGSEDFRGKYSDIKNSKCKSQGACLAGSKTREKQQGFLGGKRC